MDLMARSRWYAASVIGVGAAVAGVAALRLYLRHALPLGVLAVVLLLALLVIGFVSLARARARLAREAVDLAQKEPKGELWRARRSRLEALHAAGVRADVGALAEVTATVEHGRAYVGRYLVATTVLVGLLGTFGGLIETLGRVGPLLDDGPGHALAELAGPLAGLHVTFGASLVAILVTLALSLAQGDLNLAEDETLALLEERTQHDLFPRYWPASTSAGAELVAAVDGLRKSLPGTLADAVRASLESALTPLARELGEKAASAAKAVVGRLEAVTGDVGARTETLLRETGATLAEQSKDQAAALAAWADNVGTALRAAAATEAEALKTACVKTLDTVGAEARAQLAETNRTVTATLAQLREEASAQTASWTATATAQAEAFARATREAVSQELAALSTAAKAEAASLSEHGRAQADALKELATTEAQALAAGLGAMGAELRAQGEAQTRALTLASEAQTRALAEASQGQTQALADATQTYGRALREELGALSAAWESGDRARREGDAALSATWLAQTRSLVEEMRASLAATSERVAALLGESRELVTTWRGLTQQTTEAAVADTRALRETVTSSVATSLAALGELRERWAADAARSLEGVVSLREELAGSARVAAEQLGDVQRRVAEGATAAAASLEDVRRQIAEAAENAARTLAAMHTELARGATAAVEDSQRLRGDLAAVVETVASTWAELRTQVSEATRAAAELTAKGLGEQVGAATGALREALADAGTHWREIQESIGAHAAAWQGSTQEFRGFAEAVLETARAEAARVAGLTETAATSIREVVHARGEDLGAASAELGRAAEQLGQGMRLLTPSLTGFVTETQRLSQEVALLATRGAIEESGAGSDLVLDELERLGEGFERLSDLVKLATTPVETPPAARLERLEKEAAARTAATPDEPGSDLSGGAPTLAAAEEPPSESEPTQEEPSPPDEPAPVVTRGEGD